MVIIFDKIESSARVFRISSPNSHIFLSITKEGKSAIFNSSGNKDCHVILRGGETPNYSKKDIQKVNQDLKNSNLTQKIMVDMSHGNSQKQFKKQLIVNKDISDQIASGDQSIFGVMIESNLEEGNQKIDSLKKNTFDINTIDLEGFTILMTYIMSFKDKELDNRILYKLKSLGFYFLMNKYILGISCFYHDSAAVLMCNGQIISTLQEERLSIKKYDSRFPENAVKYCLKSNAITLFY